MWWYNVLRRSCITHWPTLVVTYFSVYVQIASTTATASTAKAANLKMASLSWPTVDRIKWFNHPWMSRDFSTLSRTILSGHGCRRSATPSPTTATSPTIKSLKCGLNRSLILSPLGLAEFVFMEGSRQFATLLYRCSARQNIHRQGGIVERASV